MPLYDYIYGTMDKSTDELYEISLKKEAESSDVVHLTHLTTPDSIYHLRLGFASLASRPYTSKWYLWLISPFTLWSMMLTWLYGRTFIVERCRFNKLRLQSWVIPKYSIQVRIVFLSLDCLLNMLLSFNHIFHLRCLNFYVIYIFIYYFCSTF
jgi:aldehyde decarbonylase